MNNIIIFFITAIIIIGSSIIYTKKYKGELLSHFNFVAITCLLVQVLAPMVWQIKGQNTYMGYEVMEYAPKATIYFLIGYIVFCITFYKLNPLNSNWITEKSNLYIYNDIKINVLWYSYLFFFINYLIFLHLRGRSFISQITLGQKGEYYNDILNTSNSPFWFLMLSNNSMVAVSIMLLFYEKKHKWCSIVVYIVTLLLTISKGYRHLMLDAIISPIIIYFVINKKTIKIWECILIVFISYLFVSWIGAMREVYRSGMGNLYFFNGEKSFEAFMYNIEIFVPYYMYIGNGTLFAYGGTYIAAVFCLIPRFLYPNKNYILKILKQNVSYTLLTNGDETFNKIGLADNYWCEGYKNFGFLGIIFVFFILAIFITKLRKNIYDSHISNIIVYGLSISFLFQILTRSSQVVIMDAIGIFLPIYIIRYISTLKNKIE